MPVSCETCAFYYEEGFDPQYVTPRCLIIERFVGADGNIEQLMEKFNGEGHCPFYQERRDVFENIRDEDVTKKIIEVLIEDLI